MAGTDGWMERRARGGVGLLVLDGERCGRKASAAVVFPTRARTSTSGKAHRKPSGAGGGFLCCHCGLMQGLFAPGAWEAWGRRFYFPPPQQRGLPPDVSCL